MPDDLPSMRFLYEDVDQWHANVIMKYVALMWSPSRGTSISSGPSGLMEIVNISFLDPKDCRATWRRPSSSLSRTMFCCLLSIWCNINQLLSSVTHKSRRQQLNSCKKSRTLLIPCRFSSGSSRCGTHRAHNIFIFRCSFITRCTTLF